MTWIACYPPTATYIRAQHKQKMEREAMPRNPFTDRENTVRVWRWCRILKKYRLFHVRGDEEE